MLDCPSTLSPQATAFFPSLWRSTVCEPPADTPVYVVPSSKGGILHCPSVFFPHATAWPSLWRSTVWLRPAETWVNMIPSSKAGMSHCPSRFFPQATARPSLLRITVWSSPAETWMYVIPSSNGGILYCPWSFSPKATASPSLRRSTLWALPADTFNQYQQKTVEYTRSVEISWANFLLSPTKCAFSYRFIGRIDPRIPVSGGSVDVPQVPQFRFYDCQIQTANLVPGLPRLPSQPRLPKENSFGSSKFIYESSSSGWWFEPLWKILVNWDDYSQYMGK